jgi:pyruvate dehydrogenase E1 component beta subunit
MQLVPLRVGKALVMRPGSDVTLVSFSKMVGFCKKAADELAKVGGCTAVESS